MLVEILTPRKLEFKKEVDSLILPTLSGEITVLPHHVPLISVLKAGRVKIKEKEKESYLETEGGIIQVVDNSVLILLKNFIGLQPR